MSIAWKFAATEGNLQLRFGLDDAAERDEAWGDRARSYVIHTMLSGHTVTSDSIRRACGDPHGSGCSVGAFFHRMEKAGWLVYTGRDVRSERPSARGRWVRVWRRA